MKTKIEEGQKMIRVFLAEDHKIVRDLLHQMLAREPDIEVVGEAGDGQSTLTRVRELSPDLVIMDISIPGLDGISVTRRIKSECEGVRVLALSTYLERRFVVSMLEAGAWGYINKASGYEELMRGIRAVAAGRRYLCQECAALLAAETADNGGVKARLGRREIEVLKLVAEGLNSPAIAIRLHITTGTVDAHRRNIREKLELHNIADLTMYAIREGLVSL